jgi:hypothetical protein
VFVHPLGFNVSINEEPLSRGAFPATLECGVQVFIPVRAAQRQPDLGEDLFIVWSRRIKVPEQTSIRGNPETPFAQHAKAAERSDGVRVQVH